MSTVTIEAADDDRPTVVPTPSHAPTVVPVDVAVTITDNGNGTFTLRRA